MSWGYVTREETVAESEKQSSTIQSDQATNVETINVDKYGKSYSVGDINIPVLSLVDESSWDLEITLDFISSF